MSDEDGRRPDIQIVLPNQHYLVDVVISHPLSVLLMFDLQLRNLYSIMSS